MNLSQVTVLNTEADTSHTKLNPFELYLNWPSQPLVG